MDIGKNIKYFRTQKGFTQKDLSEKLNVTPQAVSRWELDLVEPSLDSIKDMSELFEVTMDQLMSDNKDLDKDKLNDEDVKNIKENNNDDKKENLPIIGVCKSCGKNVKLGEGAVFTGARGIQYCKCNDCLDKEAKQLEKKKESKLKNIKLRTWILSPIIGLIVGVLVGVGTNAVELPMAIVVAYAIISGILTFTGMVCVFAKNNFVGEVWEDICEWGFIRLPGVIFTLDLDGFIWLITVKLVLWAIGILIAIVAVIAATFVAGILSIFVFPFAVYWLYKKPEKCDLDY